MSAKVILINADMTYASGPQLLQGFSGKTYGTSRWSPQHNCHTVELTMAEYDAAFEDIRRAIHLPMRRWFPRFVETEKEYPFPNSLKPVVLMPVVEAPAADAAEKHTEAQLRQIGKKHFALVAVAKRLGIETDQVKGGEALIKAILEKQS